MTASSPPGDRLTDWATGVAGLMADGYTSLDLLTAVDRIDEGEIEVVIHLVDEHSSGVFAHTRIDRGAPHLDSLVDLLPAADWHEREIAEMFGVTLVGHPRPERLLLADVPVDHPLRKDVVLEARRERPWPGANPEPGRPARRVPRPHGVPDDAGER